VSANVPTEVFDKWGVKAGEAILAGDQHAELYQQLQDSYKVEYIAGGAGQNSVRAFSWMTGKPNHGAYIGAVGDDSNGKILREAAEKDGVAVHYYTNKSGVPTGTCAVLIKERERSLIARLGAAEHYDPAHFDSEETQKLLKNATHFYATSFFLTHHADVILKMGQFAKENDKVMTINISAPFLVQFFWEKLEPVIRYSDVIFANENEAAALGEKLGFGTDLKEVAQKVGEYAKESSRPRTVVFTHGAEPTIVYHNGAVHTFQPILLPKEKIVDTNGAGDSFVGGFLSKFVDNKSIEESVAAGHYCACECIQLSGATLPATNKFSFP